MPLRDRGGLVRHPLMPLGAPILKEALVYCGDPLTLGPAFGADVTMFRHLLSPFYRPGTALDLLIAKVPLLTLTAFPIFTIRPKRTLV